MCGSFRVDKAFELSGGAIANYDLRGWRWRASELRERVEMMLVTKIEIIDTRNCRTRLCIVFMSKTFAAQAVVTTKI